MGVSQLGTLFPKCPRSDEKTYHRVGHGRQAGEQSLGIYGRLMIEMGVAQQCMVHARENVGDAVVVITATSKQHDGIARQQQCHEYPQSAEGMG